MVRHTSKVRRPDPQANGYRHARTSDFVGTGHDQCLAHLVVGRRTSGFARLTGVSSYQQSLTSVSPVITVAGPVFGALGTPLAHLELIVSTIQLLFGPRFSISVDPGMSAPKPGTVRHHTVPTVSWEPACPRFITLPSAPIFTLRNRTQIILEMTHRCQCWTECYVSLYRIDGPPPDHAFVHPLSVLRRPSRSDWSVSPYGAVPYVFGL